MTCTEESNEKPVTCHGAKLPDPFSVPQATDSQSPDHAHNSAN